jgi:hypothetical protein
LLEVAQRLAPCQQLLQPSPRRRVVAVQRHPRGVELQKVFQLPVRQLLVDATFHRAQLLQARVPLLAQVGVRLLFSVGGDFVRLALHGKQQLVGRADFGGGGEDEVGVLQMLRQVPRQPDQKLGASGEVGGAPRRRDKLLHGSQGDGHKVLGHRSLPS